jgi:hypothetical protein
LPPAAAPKATFDAETALLTHPDFELLADDGDDAAMRDPAFYAWLAAGAKTPAGEPSPDAVAIAEAMAASADEAPLETEDAP